MAWRGQESRDIILPVKALPIDNQIPPNFDPQEFVRFALPHLFLAGDYALRIQHLVEHLPAKDHPDNLFAQALSDADPSIQAYFEVLLLAAYPHLQFYGEEHAHSHNMKYFSADAALKILLDPIDGTRLYLDGKNNYQIILSVVNETGFLVAIVYLPGLETFYYACRGQGTLFGKRGDHGSGTPPQPVVLPLPQRSVTCGGLNQLQESLAGRYEIIDGLRDYAHDQPFPGFTDFFNGRFSAIYMKSAQLIDGAALAFLAQEAGALVTSFDGSPLPEFNHLITSAVPNVLIVSPHVLDVTELLLPKG